MDSEDGAFSWVANLRHRFDTFCSEADDIITQEPIESFRGQFLITCASLKQLCSELVEDAHPIFTLDFLEEGGPFSKQEENTGLLSHEVPSISTEDAPIEKSEAINSSSHLLPTDSVGEICVDFSSKKKGNIAKEASNSSETSISATLSEQDEEDNDIRGLTAEEVVCDAHAKLSTSIRSLAGDSSEKTGEISKFPAGIEEYKLPDDEVDKEATQPSEQQNDDESLIVVDTDESRLDSYMEADHLSYQKSETSVFKKLAEKHPCETASQGFVDSDIDAEEWERLNEDHCDSDWEII